MQKVGKIMEQGKKMYSSFSGQNGSGKGYNFSDAKSHYLNLPINQKRKQYQCGNAYKELKDVMDWSFLGSRPKHGQSQTSLQGIYQSDKSLNDKIGIFYGNIAALEVDAIVNAANSSLLGGGGVDAVIHKAAGRDLYEECRTLNGCGTGEAKLTGGYKLPAKYVIHAVGPIGENPLMLESCYMNSLHLAVENKLRTVAFPCVSTGVFGYPNTAAAHVVLQTVRTFLEANKRDVDKVIFCLFTDVDKKVYDDLLPHYFPLP